VAEPGFVPAPGDPLTLRTYGTFFANLDLLLRAEVTTDGYRPELGAVLAFCRR